MAVKKLAQAGHPTLKTKNQKIIDFKSPVLKKLINSYLFRIDLDIFPNLKCC